MVLVDAAAALTAWGGWLPAFLLTWVIEVPVYLLMFELFGLAGSASVRRTGNEQAGAPRPIGWGRAVVAASVTNVITHPMFWALALRLQSRGRLGSGTLLVAELCVVVVEALVVALVCRWRRPIACLVAALVANAASAVLGTAVVPYVISWVA